MYNSYNISAVTEFLLYICMPKSQLWLGTRNVIATFGMSNGQMQRINWEIESVGKFASTVTFKCLKPNYNVLVLPV